MIDLTAKRAEIQKALQSHPIAEITEGSLVTGWVVVVEWMQPNGERWLEGLDSEGTTTWGRKGMLHDALFDWREVGPGEED